MNRKGLTILPILGIVWLAGVAIRITVFAVTGKTRQCHYAENKEKQPVLIANADINHVEIK